MQKALLGIDAGTSAIKAILVTPEGRALAHSDAGYETVSPHSGWAEQSPEEWWNAAAKAVRTCVDEAGRPEVVGIGVTGMMHGFALVDEHGKMVRPAIVWMDSRARALVPEIAGHFDRERFWPEVANRIAPGLTLPILLWLTRNEPESLAAASALLFPKDYVRFRLTGDTATDVTDASATLLFHIAERRWNSRLIDHFGIDEGVLPPLRRSDDSLSPLSREAAEALGLSAGIPVAIGAADQQASAVATRTLEPGQIQLMLGTGTQVLSPIAEVADDAAFRDELGTAGSLNLFCHCDDWILQGSVQNGGSAMGWARSVLAADWSEFVIPDIESQESSPFFLPYLTGERTPIMDESALGAFFDLRFGARREELLYAALEGVAFAAADALEAVLAAQPEAAGAEIVCGGGGTRQADYIKLICDTLNRPLTILDGHDSSATGAALLGGVAAGIYSSIGEAGVVAGMGTSSIVEPKAESHARLATRRTRRDRIREAYLAAR